EAEDVQLFEVARCVLELVLGAAQLALRFLLGDHRRAAGPAGEVGKALHLLGPRLNVQGMLPQRTDNRTDIWNGGARPGEIPHLQLMLVALGRLPIAFHNTLLLPVGAARRLLCSTGHLSRSSLYFGWPLAAPRFTFPGQLTQPVYSYRYIQTALAARLLFWR